MASGSITPQRNSHVAISSWPAKRNKLFEGLCVKDLQVARPASKTARRFLAAMHREVNPFELMAYRA
tara:strand:- start:379 stop:579 length:201 start_codon:yes stop_codon:yes gene_type:complete